MSFGPRHAVPGGREAGGRRYPGAFARICAPASHKRLSSRIHLCCRDRDYGDETISGGLFGLGIGSAIGFMEWGGTFVTGYVLERVCLENSRHSLLDVWFLCRWSPRCSTPPVYRPAASGKTAIVPGRLKISTGVQATSSQNAFFPKIMQKERDTEEIPSLLRHKATGFNSLPHKHQGDVLSAKVFFFRR